MAMQSLQYKPFQGVTSPIENKTGSYIFAGEPSHFHEWGFRTTPRFAGATKKPAIGTFSNVVEGLRGDVLHASMTIGFSQLSPKKEFDDLIDAIQRRCSCCRTWNRRSSHKASSSEVRWAGGEANP